MTAQYSAARTFFPCRIDAANGSGSACCQRLTRGIMVFSLVGTVLSGVRPALAQEWRVQPSATVGLVFNDNIELSDVDPQSSMGANLGFAVRVLRSMENASLGLRGALRQTTYFNVGELDTTAGLLGLDLGYSTERSQFGLITSFTTQSTQTSEETTTGLSDANGQQYRLNISPFWSYLLSERASMELSLSYDDVFYDDVEGSSLSNYRSGAISVGGRYRLTEQATLDALLGYGRFEATERQTDAVNAELGAGYAISETLSLNFLLGLQRSESITPESNGGGASRRSTGPTYTLSLNKDLARGGAFTMSASRSLVPSGAGDILDTTMVNADLRYPFSERWRLRLGGQVFRNREPGTEREESVLYAAAGEVGLSYQVRESLSIQLGYRYRWQNDEQEQAIAESNQVSVTLAWQPR